MLDPKNIHEIIQQVVDALPEGLKNMPNDVRQNMRSCLQSALEKCDLVTREEFDAQRGVLLRTREKLEILEQKIAELEKGANQHSRKS